MSKFKRGESTCDRRHLVVIDPEDAEQVKRLWLISAALGGIRWYPSSAELALLKQALFQFAEPPTPCLAAVNIHLSDRFVSSSCAEPKGHEGSHRSKAGTSWDATEADR